MTLRVLLDTNIWAYVADDDAAAVLRQLARDHDLEVLISPAVVFEQLRMRDEERRKQHLDITTRRWWTRLMPEAFVECEELVAALGKHRPGWILNPPPPAATKWFHQNRADWLHGFWTRARRFPTRQAGHNDTLGGETIVTARTEVAAKKAFSRTSNVTLDTVSLTDPDVTNVELFDPANGRRFTTQYWRLGAATHFAHQLARRGQSNTYRDWLDPFLDHRRTADQRAWMSFWMEVAPTEVPTQWLFWAAGVLVPLVKVNDGSVFDVQLAAYMARADVFVTADRNLARVAQAMADAAPIPIARPVRARPTSWTTTLAALGGG